MDEPDRVRSTGRPGRRGATAVRPAQLFGEYDDERFALLALDDVDAPTLVRALGVDRLAAAVAVRAARRGSFSGLAGLLRARPTLLSQLQHIRQRTYLRGETPLHVVDVRPAEPVRDGVPFTLLVGYQNVGESPVVLVSVLVAWRAEAFVVEQAVDTPDDVVAIRFDEQRTLPLGPADFTVSVFRSDGTTAMFHRGVFVLPAAGPAVAVGPPGSAVTRSAYRPDVDDFLAEVPVTIANGMDDPLQLDRTPRWELRDGDTTVDAGALTWPTPIAIPGLGVWRASVEIRSPRGSPAFAAYEQGRDLAVLLTVVPGGGDAVTAATVSRTMPTFGVHLIKVGTFEAGESADLTAALAEVARHFERHSFGVTPVECRQIADADAGALVALRDDTAFGDLLQGWTCPNLLIDLFVVQLFDWNGVNALTGHIPGPEVKGGREDGAATTKRGYGPVGAAHLVVDELGNIIAHELGHYLGLKHNKTDKTNLMYEFAVGRGTNLDDGQRKKIAKHGFVHKPVV
jgi:hypothetical protein